MSELENTIEETPRLELNGPVPDFEANTTHGPIKLSEWNKDKWVILFSHPADFTPVCTTEFMAFAKLSDELAKRNVTLLGNSIDSIYSHIAWVRNIKQELRCRYQVPDHRGPRHEGGEALRDDPRGKRCHRGRARCVLH